MVIVSSIFIASFCFQLCYMLWVRHHIYADTAVSTATFREQITFIICAKNEGKNLEKYLPLWLAQEDIDFTLLIVDDGSTDNTASLIADIIHPRLQYHHISPDEKVGRGKKYALQKGIALADTPWVLLTDADCMPCNNFWAANMMQYAADSDVVLGISPYMHKDTGLLSALIDYETFLTAAQYTAWANARMAYMGVGRNMAYKKSLTQYIDSDSYYGTASGDDDIFIQNIWKKARIATAIDIGSHTYSYAPETFWSWVRQKSRHYSTGFHYDLVHQMGLGSFIFSKVMMHVSGVYALFHNYTLGLLVYVAYLCISIGLFFSINKKMKMPLNIWWIFFTDIIMSLMYVLVGFYSKSNSNRRWK